MQWILILLAASVVLSAMKFLVSGLVVVLAISLVWGALCRPQETFGLLFFLLVAQVVTEHTGAALAVTAVLGFLLICRGPAAPQKNTTDGPKLPPPGS
jgi:hypothetical protein